MNRPGLLRCTSLLLSLCFANAALAQVDNDQQQRMLPSPFGTQLDHAAPEESPTDLELAEGNLKHIVIETRFITCEPAQVGELFALVDSDLFESSGSQIRSQEALVELENRKPAVALTSTIRQAPATWGEITAEELTRLFDAVRADARTNITQAPTMTVFDGQTGTVFDGTLQPFIVDIDVVQGDFTERAFQPVVQPIEEGNIIKLGAQITETGRIQLDSQLIVNEIESVGEREFLAGRAKGARIQIPRCHTQMVRLHSELANGGTLMIETGIDRRGEERVEQTRWQKVPVVGIPLRRVTTVGIERASQRLILLITVRAIDPSEFR